MYIVKVDKKPIPGTNVSKFEEVAFIINEEGEYLSRNYEIMDRMIMGAHYDKYGSMIPLSCSPLRAARIAKRLNKYGTARIFSCRNDRTVFVTVVSTLLLLVYMVFFLKEL